MYIFFEGSILVSSAEKSEIVNKHNDLRRSVQPTASNMLEMVTFHTATCSFSIVHIESRKVLLLLLTLLCHLFSAELELGSCSQRSEMGRQMFHDVQQ